MEIHSLPELEASSLNQAVGRATLPLKPVGESFLAFSWLLAVAGSPLQSLACSCNTSISAFEVPRCSPCVSLSSHGQLLIRILIIVLDQGPNLLQEDFVLI